MASDKSKYSESTDTHRQQTGTRFLIGIFGILLVGYIINSIDRTSFPVFITDVRAEYGFGLGEAGLMSTVSYLGMGLAGFPAGYLVDRFSRKHLYNFGMLLFSVFTILTVVAVTYWDMLIYRVLTGVGESLQLTALLTIAGILFSRHRGAAIGAVNTSFALGSFIGPYAGGLLLTAYSSWRVPMVVFGLIGLLAFVAVVIWVPARVIDKRFDHASPSETTGGATTVVNANTAILAVATGLGGLVTFGFLGMYVTFLREELGFSAATAGLLFSLHGLGAVASLLGGFLGDRLDPRVLMSGAYAVTAVLGVVMFAGPTDAVSQGVLSFALGVVYSGTVYVNSAGYLVKSVHQQLAGRASGIFMTSMYVPAAFAGSTIGLMASNWGWSTAGMVQISLCSAIGAAICLFLRPGRFSRPLTIEAQ